MKVFIKKPKAHKAVSRWNSMSAIERLHFILTHEDIFLRANLVREGELLAAKVTPESCREYILEREENPFFSFLNINAPLEDQGLCLLDGFMQPST